MPDPLNIVIERIDTIRSKLKAFQLSSDAYLLEDTLEELEEVHEEIEDILDDGE